VHRPTIEVYESRAGEWERRRRGRAVGSDHPAAFAADAARTAADQPLIDLGCGPGWALPALGTPTIALDAARAMLDLVPRYAPKAGRVQADLAALPFRRAGLGGAWASKSYVHLRRAELPLALAELHRALADDTLAELLVFAGEGDGVSFAGDDFPGRRFSLWSADLLELVVAGAGFAIEAWSRAATRDGEGQFRIRLRRERTLPDYVGSDMRLLLVGLNPSFFAADAGVGFARPGNRFWPAAVRAGLTDRALDARRLLTVHGVGMTDLVKRATARAAELDAVEYRNGLERLRRLVAWLRPSAVCMVGLSGWRAATDGKATTGWQAGELGGAPVYVMPNTSGLNARTSLDELVSHLRAALRPPG
jgi:TDG/mug DNA glycosylase family protein